MARKARGNETTSNAAAEVGAMLKRISTKVNSLKQERDALAAELDDVIRAAQQMKADIGKSGGDVRTDGRTRRKLSPEGRARIAEGARRRWAAFHKAQGKK